MNRGAWLEPGEFFFTPNLPVTLEKFPFLALAFKDHLKNWLSWLCSVVKTIGCSGRVSRTHHPIIKRGSEPLAPRSTCFVPMTDRLNQLRAKQNGIQMNQHQANQVPKLVNFNSPFGGQLLACSAFSVSSTVQPYSSSLGLSSGRSRCTASRVPGRSPEEPEPSGATETLEPKPSADWAELFEMKAATIFGTVGRSRYTSIHSIQPFCDLYFGPPKIGSFPIKTEVMSGF